MMYLFFYVCLCKPRTFSTCPCANPITATRTCHSTSLHAPNNHHAFIYNINVPLFMRLDEFVLIVKMNIKIIENCK